MVCFIQYFRLLFENREINVLAYNLETVISEKFEGIITKGIANTRARDYYDLYILEKLQKNNINNKMLKQAIINKFRERQTYNFLESINEQIQSIENSDELKEIWKNYQSKFSYAEDISYEETIRVIKNIANILK